MMKKPTESAAVVDEIAGVKQSENYEMRQRLREDPSLHHSVPADLYPENGDTTFGLSPKRKRELGLDGEDWHRVAIRNPTMYANLDGDSKLRAIEDRGGHLVLDPKTNKPVSMGVDMLLAVVPMDVKRAADARDAAERKEYELQNPLLAEEFYPEEARERADRLDTQYTEEKRKRLAANAYQEYQRVKRSGSSPTMGRSWDQVVNGKIADVMRHDHVSQDTARKTVMEEIRREQVRAAHGGRDPSKEEWNAVVARLQGRSDRARAAFAIGADFGPTTEEAVRRHIMPAGRRQTTPPAATK